MRNSLYALVLLSSMQMAHAMPIVDVVGDNQPGAFTSYDITSINATFTATTLTFLVQLTTNPIAPSVNMNTGLSGFIDIDIDLNPGSGASSNISTLGFPFGSSGLGIEFYLDLFSEVNHAGFVDVRNPINVMNVTTAPITYGVNQFSVAVPLSQLANDDGLVNYVVAVGDFSNATDQAVDAASILQGGLPAISSPAAAVPAPSSIALLFGGVLLLMQLGHGRREC